LFVALSKVFEGLMKDGCGGGRQLYAVLGSASGHAEPDERGNRMAGDLEKLARELPSFAAIAVSDLVPKYLPKFFKDLCDSRGFEIKTFEFLPRGEHLERASRHDAWTQTLPGSLAHLTLAINAKEGSAVLAQLQGNLTANRFSNSLNDSRELESYPLTPEESRNYHDFLSKYKNTHLSLFLAAKQYCDERGLELHLPSPKLLVWLNANNLHSQHSHVDPVDNINKIINSTRRNAKKIFESSRGEFPLPPDVKQPNSFKDLPADCKRTLVFRQRLDRSHLKARAKA